MLNCQKSLAHKLLKKLQCQPFASKLMFNAFLGECININSISQSYEPTIQTAIWLLRTGPVLDKLTTADNPLPKRSLLPFLQDALHLLTGMATMKCTKVKQ